VAHTKQEAKNRLVMPPAEFSTIDRGISPHGRIRCRKTAPSKEDAVDRSYVDDVGTPDALHYLAAQVRIK
jgi:hypothetical protein